MPSRQSTTRPIGSTRPGADRFGLVANGAKTGTYDAYERVWDRITWGLESPSS